MRQTLSNRKEDSSMLDWASLLLELQIDLLESLGLLQVINRIYFIEKEKQILDFWRETITKRFNGTQDLKMRADLQIIIS